MCILCKEMQPKKNMIRVVKNNNNQIFVDNTGKANGRGAYVCLKPECQQNLTKQKSLNRVFKSAVDNEIYNNLIEVAIAKHSNKQN